MGGRGEQSQTLFVSAHRREGDDASAVVGFKRSGRKQTPSPRGAVGAGDSL